MLKVALYIRVSTDEQALHGESIDTQKNELNKYALKNNYNIVDYYIDEGYTATNLKRPALERLLEDVQSNKIDMILFTKIDRWSRGVRNYYKLQDILDKHKVDWKTIFENYDTSTAAGRLHINIMLSVAENESAQTSERIRAVFKSKLEKGEVCSGSVPTGFKIENKKLVIIPEDVEMIKEIFKHYESSNSLAKTLSYIQSNYKHISRTTLSRILKNPLYAGNHRSDRVNFKFCEQIISQEQFDKIQRMLKINQKNYKSKYEDKGIYIFTGLLKCKVCGYNLVGNRRRRYNIEKGDYMYKVYKCQKNFKENLCTNSYRIPETNILEKYLVDNIQSEIKMYILDYTAKLNAKRINDTTNARNTLKAKLERLKDLYVDGLIDKDTYKKDYIDINNQINDLAPVEAPKEVNVRLFEEFLKLDLKQCYYDLDDISRRRLWISIIDCIVIGTDRNDITIKFL